MMALSLKITGAGSLLFAMSAVVAKWLALHQDDPFENAYATICAASTLAFVLTAAYLVLGMVILWSIGEGVDNPWLWTWTVFAGLGAAWFVIRLLRFLFPYWWQ